MGDCYYHVYMIRLQRSKKMTDVERFWFYETKEEAKQVAAKLHGYKVSVEKYCSSVPFEELIKINKTRYPNINN